MNTYKKQILDNICYTELVYGRINKKLNRNYAHFLYFSHVLMDCFPYELTPANACSSDTSSSCCVYSAANSKQ